MNFRISILVRAVSLCHTAKGPAQGAFGLRWSPVPPSAQDIKSETRSVSFLFSLREGKDKSPLRRTHKKRPPLLQQSLYAEDGT